MKCNEFRIEQIPAEEYHQRPELSHSGAKDFAKRGPWYFHHRYNLRTIPGKESDALNLGRAFHAAIENPEAWRESYIEEPIFVTISGQREQVSKKKPSHRAALAEWRTEQTLAGKTILLPGQVDSVREMTLSMLDNPAAVEYLEAPGHAEIAGFAVEETTGIAVRALADRWLPDWPEGATVVDWKTTIEDTPEEWARTAIERWGYHFQGDWYTGIFHAERFVNIVVRSEPPWECWVRVMNPTIIRRATAQNLQTLRQIKHRRENDDWHNNGWGAEYPLIDEEQG